MSSPSSSGSDVEGEQSDFATRLNWVRGWQSAFFSLYCGVMAVSLFLYLCLLRAVARDAARIPLYSMTIRRIQHRKWSET